MNSHRKKYFIKRKHQNCRFLSKILLKNKKLYVIINLPNIVNKQSCLQTNIWDKLCRNIIKNEGRNTNTMPINIKNAANYLIQLFYSYKRDCRSQVLQKILIIAQLKCLKELKKPLFLDDIIVKPACFSIDYVSKMYSTVVLEGNSENTPFDKVADEMCVGIKVEPFEIATHPLSYSYEITEEIPESFLKIINTTFSFFGIYSGNAIGECMKKLSLHTNAVVGSSLSVEQLQNFICDLENNKLDSNDMKNPIVQFLLL